MRRPVGEDEDGIGRCAPMICSAMAIARVSERKETTAHRPICIQRLTRDRVGIAPRKRGPLDADPTAHSTRANATTRVQLVDWAESSGSSPSPARARGTVQTKFEFEFEAELWGFIRDSNSTPKMMKF